MGVKCIFSAKEFEVQRVKVEDVAVQIHRRALRWLGKVTRGVRKLSLNCLFAGRKNNNFDLCRPPGNQLDNLTTLPIFTYFSNLTIVVHPGIMY